MTATPFFVERPTPPTPGTEEYARWRKEGTINFSGGYLEATYGNLAQTFAMTNTDACDFTTVNVNVRSHQRVNTIGEGARTIGGHSYTKRSFPGRNSSLAAGGQPITIITDIGSYTARLGGKIEDFAAWLCGDGAGQLMGSISFMSSRGRNYGPFGPIAAGTPEGGN